MDKTSQKGRGIHGKAEIAREKEQDFLKALQFIDETTIAYQMDGDYYGLSEVQGSRFNTFKHLYQKTGDRAFLILAKYAALSAVEIGENSGISDSLGIPYRDLGKAYMELEEYEEAEKALGKSLHLMKISPPKIHDKNSIRAEIQGHLGEAQYKLGKKEEGLANLGEAISILKNEESTYEVDVWLSGAHMRTAEVLREDNLELAKLHLQKAKQIIYKNPELKLRFQQWKKLEKSFNG